MLEGGRGSTGDIAMKNLPCQLQWEVPHRSPFSETSSFYFWSCIQDRTVGFYKFLSISWRFLSSSKSKIDVFLIISIRYFHFTGQAVHCKWIIPSPLFFSWLFEAKFLFVRVLPVLELLCWSGCPWTQRDPPASASQEPVLMVWATTAHLISTLQTCCFCVAVVFSFIWCVNPLYYW